MALNVSLSLSSTCCKFLNRSLQQRKSSKEASQNNGQSVSASNFKSNTGSLLSAAAAASARATWYIRVDRVRAVCRRGGCRAGGLGLVGSHGVLGTAKVVLLAV